jgi:hypothetical protein
MAIKFGCTLCGNPVSAPDSMAGKVGKCPKCKARVSIPDMDAPLVNTMSTTSAPPPVDAPDPLEAERIKLEMERAKLELARADVERERGRRQGAPAVPVAVVAKMAATRVGYCLAGVAAVALMLGGCMVWAVSAIKPWIAEKKRQADERLRAKIESDRMLAEMELERARMELAERQRVREAEAARKRTGVMGTGETRESAERRRLEERLRALERER